MPNQPFNAEEWLNSTKKKGISGKIPRADFIAKMKELGATIEELKKDKNQLTTKDKELEQKLTTSQTELTNRDQIIKDKDKEIENLKNKSEQSEQKNNFLLENTKKLETKIEEQDKTIEELKNEVKNQGEELNKLQSKPNITEEKYQELLNNQEKHAEEDLKPTNLPTDWEKQLSDKKTLETKLLETETKLKIAEQRPTPEQLQQAVQQEIEKYKDYDSIKTSLDKWKDNYSEIKKKHEELQAQEGNLQPPISIEEIIKSIKELLNSALNPLQLEIAELKKQLINNPLPESSSSKLPTDYKELKIEKEELLKILGTLKLRL